jgi:hypothetical protein
VSRDHFLEIGGITIALRCRDQRLSWQWSAPMQRFLIPAAEVVEVDLTVDVFEDSAPSGGELLFESGGVWRMYRDGSGYRIECSSDAFGAGPYKVARFNESFTRGEILIRRDVLPLGLAPLDYPLDELLMVNLLGRNRGVELHSCGVIDKEGRGRLFVGMSGAGKSTTAHLWEGSSRGVVSDDRVIIREDNGALWMYGTPWHGEAELSLAERVPLLDVYLLVQAPSNEIRALPAAAAVTRLLTCSFPPFHDAASVSYTLAFLERLVRAVPVRELRFTRDRSVVDLVLAA